MSPRGGSASSLVSHNLQIAPWSFLLHLIPDIGRNLILAEPSYLGRSVLEQKDTICCHCKLQVSSCHPWPSFWAGNGESGNGKGEVPSPEWVLSWVWVHLRQALFHMWDVFHVSMHHCKTVPADSWGFWHEAQRFTQRSTWTPGLIWKPHFHKYNDYRTWVVLDFCF